MKKFLLALLFSALPALGQYTPPYVGITGSLGSANGMPASNYTLTFVPSQVMYVGGTATIVANANCGTDANGAVVGTPNPLRPPVLNVQPGTGTLPPANYYVEITWLDAFSHETLPSAEATIQLTVAGSILVSPPTNGVPLSAIAMNVYIGTSSGAETYQGRNTSPAGTYTQSVPLTSPAPALPTFNATVCMLVANDAAWPIGGYQMNFTTPAGNNVPGFPQQVQFIGPGSAFNISNGIPIWNGRVTYPVPVLTLPYNHQAQSISGPLSMQGYNVYNVGKLGVGTALPAWGIDVEGSGSNAAINANQGYLVNGSGGTAGQCLGSDGSYWDTPINCVTSLPAFFYQTVLNGSTAATAVTQRAYLALGSGTGLFANDVVGVGSQVSRTVLNVNAYPTITTATTDPYVVMTQAGGSAGQFACWDGTTGGITGSNSLCSGSSTYADKMWIGQTLCTPATSTDASCTGTYTFPSGFSFADASYGVWLTGWNSAGAGVYAVGESKTASTFTYTVYCTFGCSSYGGGISFDIRATHN